MPKIWEAKPVAAGLRFGIVVGKFNSTITDRLLEGALDALGRAGVDDGDIEIARVPGSFEIPVAAMRLARSGRFSAIVCLGAIIRGATAHWDYLSHTVTSSLSHVALECDLPVTNAVLTTETAELASERAVRGRDNRGYAAAIAAVEMAVLFRELGADEGEPRDERAR